MLVKITQTFDTGARRWFAGENPDVSIDLARQWIANGYAVADTDGLQGFPLTADQTASGPSLSGAGAAAVSTATLARLDRAARVAAQDNPLTRTPLTAVPAWASSTAYLAGAWCSNDGNDYMCRVAGTSAASGGPTGTSYADITDGTVQWQFIQPQRATTTADSAPTITVGETGVAKPADLLRQFRAIEEASSFAFYGGVPTQSSASGVIFPAISSVLAGTVVTTTPGKDNVNPCIHFMTDALVIAIEGGSTMTAQRRFTIEIDGVLYRDSPIVGTGATAERYIYINFTGKGRKPRSIKVYWRRGAPEEFRGVWVSAIDNVWAPPKALCGVWLGDSHTAGSLYGGVNNSGDDVATKAAQLLGIDNMVNIGQGSAGFSVTLSGQRYKFGERIADATVYDADLLVIAGAHNDATSTYEDIKTEILAYLRSYRAVRSNAVIVCFGTWKSLGRTEAEMDKLDSAMRDAVAEFGDSLCVFRSIRGWLRGRKTGAITGITNASSAVITVANDAVVGEMVILYNVLGMTGINGVVGRVTAATSSTITVNINSTGLGTFSTSASSFVVLNDARSSADGLHLQQQGVNGNAWQYAQELREVFATLSQKLTG